MSEAGKGDRRDAEMSAARKTQRFLDTAALMVLPSAIAAGLAGQWHPVVIAFLTGWVACLAVDLARYCWECFSAEKLRHDGREHGEKDGPDDLPSVSTERIQ